LNATRLRLALAAGETGYPQFVTQGYHDLIRLEGSDLMDALEQSYSKFGPEDTIIICRSNKRANQYNQAIRQRIRWQEDEISTGDYVMIVKNNYFWLPQDSKAGFLANGDTAIIRRINKYREMHGFRFADVTIQLLDYPDEPELDTRIILDSLHTEAPALMI
jgi:exodeoxyribonuclease-5